ncbi:hypothetical protein JHK87_028779 [Glycine soja]|nr:hypothetical protein JHK87_028779 [Glycine soja]
MVTNTTTASSSIFSLHKLNFWLDDLSPISLTADQANRPVTEIDTQKICAVALDPVNVRKNRHDVYQVPVLVELEHIAQIHNTIQRILAGDISAVNIADTVTTFRTQRLRMAQYNFCYIAIIEELDDLLSQQ